MPPQVQDDIDAFMQKRSAAAPKLPPAPKPAPVVDDDVDSFMSRRTGSAPTPKAQRRQAIVGLQDELTQSSRQVKPGETRNLATGQTYPTITPKFQSPIDMSLNAPNEAQKAFDRAAAATGQQPAAPKPRNAFQAPQRKPMLERVMAQQAIERQQPQTVETDPQRLGQLQQNTQRQLAEQRQVRQMQTRENVAQMNPLQRMAVRGMAKFGGATDADMAATMPVSRAESAMGQFGQGAITTAARIPEGLERLGEAIPNPFTSITGQRNRMMQDKAEARARGENTGFLTSGITKAGDAFADTVAPIDETDQSFLTAKLPRGLGSSVPFLASSALGGGMPAAAAMGAAINAQQTGEDMDKLGVQDEATRRKATAVAGLIGSLEAFGIEGKLGKVFGGRGGLTKRLLGAGGEGLQEWTTEELNDINAKLIAAYDPNRSINPFQRKQLEAAALGALTGGLFEAGGKVAEMQRDAQAVSQTRAERPVAPTDIRPTTMGPTQVTPLSQAPAVPAPSVTPAASQPLPAATAPTTPLPQAQPQGFPRLPEPEGFNARRAKLLGMPTPAEVNINEQVQAAAQLLDSPNEGDQRQGRRMMNQALTNLRKAEGYLAEAALPPDAERPFTAVRDAIEARLKPAPKVKEVPASQVPSSSAVEVATPTAANALRAEADAAKIKAADFEQVGDFTQAAATYQAAHQNLKRLRRSMGQPKTPEAVAQINQIDREISIADANRRKAMQAGRTAQRQANAPTAGMAKTAQNIPNNIPAAAQPVESAPLLRPDAVQNPEPVAPVEERTGDTIDFTSKTPARKRGGMDTENLTIGGMLKRRFPEGVRLADKGEARNLGGREGNALVGLVNKNSRVGVDDVAYALHEEGLRLPDGRSFVENSRVVATEAEVLDFLRSNSKQKVGGTKSLERRLAEEEAAYNKRQPFDQIVADVDAVEREAFQPDTADLREVREFAKREPRTEAFTDEPPTAPLARRRQPIRPPAPTSPRQVGNRPLSVDVAGTRTPVAMSPDFPRARREMVQAGREVEARLEMGQEKGEFGNFANAMFKSNSPDVLHGQDSFFHDPDVKGKLGLTRDAEMGEVRKELKTQLAKSLGVTVDEVSLSHIKPDVWRAWARQKGLGRTAMQKLEAGINRAERKENAIKTNAQISAEESQRGKESVREPEGKASENESKSVVKDSLTTETAPTVKKTLTVQKTGADMVQEDLGAEMLFKRDIEDVPEKWSQVLTGIRDGRHDGGDPGGSPYAPANQVINSHVNFSVDGVPYYGIRKRQGWNLYGGKYPTASARQPLGFADTAQVFGNTEIGFKVSSVKPKAESSTVAENATVSSPIKTGDSVTWQRGNVTESGKVTKVNGAYVTAETTDGETITRDKSKFTAAPKIREQKTPGFYSQLQRVIEQKMPAKASAAQVRAIIENPQSGVKPDEVKWTGLDDYLRGKETVTKAEVTEFLKANQVEVQEVMHGQPIGDMPIGWTIQQEGSDQWTARTETGAKVGSWPTEEAARKWVKDRMEKPATKYGQYVLPGAKEGSYRELLLTLPNTARTMDKIARDMGFDGWSSYLTKEQEQKVVQAFEAQKQKPSDTYKSSHFDEPNILAHLRFNERTDSDGKKAMHVEEIQSDWHQEGRKRGYKSNPVTVEDVELRRVGTGDTAYWESYNKRTGEMITRHPGNAPEASARREAVMITQPDLQSGVPDAPFKKNWHELAFKRALRYAAENGYERMTWTTGEQQAERFDLSKQIDMLRYSKNDDGAYSLDGDLAHEGGEHNFGTFTADKLPDVVGKDIAEKIIAGEGGTSKDGRRFLKGVDLKVGSEGMKGFYDQILPAFANKYGRKWGVKVGEAKIDVSQGRPTEYEDFDAWKKAKDEGKTETVHSIDITPAMRESVMQGQALFQKGDKPTAADAISEAKIQFKSGKRGQPGTLYANEPALDVLRAAYEKVFGRRVEISNVNLNSAASRRIAQELMKAADDPDFAPDMQEKLQEISREFNFAWRSGKTVSIVSTAEGRKFSDIKASRRHELFHDAQEGLENSSGFLAKHKYGKQLIEGLAHYNFEDRTVEAAAFLAGGQAKDFGLTDAQGKEFLADYFDDIVAVNGADALRRFVSMAPQVQDALKEARQKYDIQRNTGSNQRGARTEAASGRTGATGETARSGARVSEQKTVAPPRPARRGQVLASGLGAFQNLFERDAKPKEVKPAPLPKDFDLAKWSQKSYNDALVNALSSKDRAEYNSLKTAREKQAFLFSTKIDPDLEAKVFKLIDRAAEAYEKGDGTDFQAVRDEVRSLLAGQVSPSLRDVKWYDHLQSRLSNVNFKGTYERIAGEQGKEISEIFRNAQVDAANGKITRAEAVTRLQRELKPYVRRLKSSGKPGLARWVENHIDAVSDPDQSFKGLAGFLRGFQYNTKLRLNPRSALINTLQPFQTLWPHLTTTEWLRIQRDAARPSMWKRVSEVAARESGGSIEEVNDKKRLLGWADLFSPVSEYNRIVGHLAGELFADRNGLTGDAKARMAADWAKKVEFDNSAYDIPPLFSGKIAGVVGQFKPFMVKNLERLYTDWKSAPPEALATNSWKGAGTIARRSKMITAQFLIGGVRAGIPGLKTIGGVLVLGALAKGFGKFMDDDKAEKLAEAVYFGAPALVEQDLSGSVAIFDEPFGKTGYEKIVNFAGGPTLSLIAKAYEEGKNINEAEDSKTQTKAEKQQDAALRLAKTITPYTKWGIAGAAAMRGERPSLWLGKEVPMTKAETAGYSLLGTPLRQSKYYEHKEAFDWQKNLMPDRFEKENKKTGTRILPDGKIDAGMIRQKVGEPEAIYKQRVERVEGWMSEYGDKLLSHPRYGTLTAAQQEAAIESLRRRIGTQQNAARPRLDSLTPEKIIQSVLKSEATRPKREAGKLWSPPANRP